jgi:hypothetical protein
MIEAKPQEISKKTKERVKKRKKILIGVKTSPSMNGGWYAT